MARRATLARRSDREETRGSRRGGTKWGGYQKRTSEQVKARAEQTGGRFDSYLQQGIDMFRPKNGDNTIRYLPPTWANPEHYGYDVWVHGFIGVDGSSYLCLDKMKKERCPICIASKEAKDAGDDEEAKALACNKRVLAWVLDRDEDEPKAQVYSQSWSFDRDIAALCDTKKGTIYIDHDEEGYDVTFKKKGQGLNTRYFGTQIDRDPSPICEDPKDQDEVLDYITDNPIPDILKFYSAEQLQKVIEGTAETKDEDLDEDDKDDRPRSRGRRDSDDERPSRQRTRGRDEEQEEAPRGRTHRGRDDEAEERPRGGSRERTRGGRDEEPEERPRTGRRTESRDDAEEDRPRRGRRAADDETAEERPTRRSRESRDVADEEPRQRGSRRASRDEEDEPEPYEEEAVEEPQEEDERPARRRGSDRRDRQKDFDDEIPF